MIDTIRSEKPSLQSLDQVFGELKKAVDVDEIATLLTLITELYSDASCRCEEKAASFGDNSSEVRECNLSVIKSRDNLFQVYSDIVKRLMKRV